MPRKLPVPPLLVQFVNRSGLDQTVGASAGVRSEGVSEWLQRVGAVVEDRKNRVLLVCRECELAPVRIEGRADVVGKLPLSGALKTTCEYCHSGGGQHNTGDQHRGSVVARVCQRANITY